MPRRSQEQLARIADGTRRAANTRRVEPMSFLEAGTPIRYLTAKMLERRENRRRGVDGMSSEELEADRPRRRAVAAAAEREFTDSLGRYKDGGMVRGCKSSQMSGKGFRGTY